MWGEQGGSYEDPQVMGTEAGEKGHSGNLKVAPDPAWERDWEQIPRWEETGHGKRQKRGCDTEIRNAGPAEVMPAWVWLVG